MSFIEAIKSCFRNYIWFSGRARRSEFWYFFLFYFSIDLALTIILGENPIIRLLFTLAMLPPSLAVQWRRLHDVGMRGIWSLLSLIPIVGTLIILGICCVDGDTGPNAYGPSPKYPENTKS